VARKFRVGAGESPETAVSTPTSTQHNAQRGNAMQHRTAVPSVAAATYVLDEDVPEARPLPPASSAPKTVGENRNRDVGGYQSKSHAHPRPTSSAHPRVGMGKGEKTSTSKNVNRDDLQTDRGWIEWVKKRNRFYPRRRYWIGSPGNWKKSKPVYITDKLGSKSEDEYEQYKERKRASRDLRKQHSKS
jgi:hypothetical protein